MRSSRWWNVIGAILLLAFGVFALLLGLVAIVGVPMMERSALRPGFGWACLVFGCVCFATATALFQGSRQ